MSMSHLFSSKMVEGVKETIADKAAIVTGYKDQLLGVKETVGHFMGDKNLKKEGHKQKCAARPSSPSTGPWAVTTTLATSWR
jgi:hypothetical protein